MGSLHNQNDIKDDTKNRRNESSSSVWFPPTNQVVNTIPTESFYVAKDTTSRNSNTQVDSYSPPSLPKRRSEIGSSHTTYNPPQAAEEKGGASYSVFREPELVSAEEEGMLTQPNFDWTAHEPAGFITDQHSWHSGTGYTSDIKQFDEVQIDGRNETEEKEWWNPDSTGKQRPGPGMLPPLLADELHHPDHSLFSVSVSFPDLRPPSPSPGVNPSSGSSPPSTGPVPSKTSRVGSHSPSPSISLSNSAFVLPTQQECLEAIPHPNAYYCRRHHGWVILAWKSSGILPPLTSSFTANNHHLLPDKDRRRQRTNCLTEPVYGQAPNKTHHFHKYEKAVDAAHMTPHYSPRQWELHERQKKTRRRMTIGADQLDPNMVSHAVEGDLESQKETQMVTDLREEEESRDILDLYVCCQCSFYVLVSDVIPGVFANKYIDELYREKYENPPPGQSGEQSVYNAWETIQTAIENKLWKGNDKSLAVNGRVFSSKVGWSAAVQKIFESLGFVILNSSTPEASSPENGSVASQGIRLVPPRTDLDNVESRMNRERMLRAWVEIGAYLADFRRRFPKATEFSGKTKHWVKIESAREMYQTAIGAHPDQIKRYQYSDAVYTVPSDDSPWVVLGLTQSTYDSALLQFAYYAQCRCDPSQTPRYFDALVRIVQWLNSVIIVPQELESLIVTERSRGRFNSEDVQKAIWVLGFGSDNCLKVDYDEDVDDNFLLHAWKDAVRRSWNEPEAASRRRDLNEAIRIVAEWKRSTVLMKAWDAEVTNAMTPDKAYDTLEVPVSVDEEMLIAVYTMRVEEQPSQLEKMRDALRCIAEFTRSERLEKFLESGIDPGVVVAPTRPDWPRGLNQLGNTCYLNSLLQYFYTIKDLRDAIVPYAPLDEKFLEHDNLKDDDLKNHRVGGRLVSRHEVVRSRKFVSQLSSLFWYLENSEAPSVTPSLELAKLALVTSKDEEEDDLERGGTDSSHSTDATLVDEPVPSSSLRDSPELMPRSSTDPASPSSASSVLGKRSRGPGRKQTGSSGHEDSIVAENVNSDKDEFVLVPKQSSSTTDGPIASGSHTPSTMRDGGTPTTMKDDDNDVEMMNVDPAPATKQVVKAPPLPPRPKYSTSEMMFGRQHDVAECMDNCMFQIETALLRFGDLAGSDDAKRSIVKRLFYGKIRQRLSLPPSRSKSSLHEREDYFSHLPVNVSEESFDLYDGLSGYFDDVVEFEGTKAKMEVSLVELPPILQIQLQRVQFNRDTLQPYKSHAYVKFGETICMDRFLDDAPAEKKARSKEVQAELTACRERINKLTQGKFAPFEQHFEYVADFLSNPHCVELPGATNALTSTVLSEKDNITREIAECRARAAELKAQLEAIWVDEMRAEYELASVFIHRGPTPTFGHYFIYQRWLPDHKDEWFKYNDSDVSLATKEEVLADTTGSTANPYLLVFVRKDSQVVETVRRAEPMLIG